MALQFIAKDPNTDGRDCPTLWVEDEAEEILIQGWKPDGETLAKCRETGPIPETEAVVRVPFRMIPAIREACDVAERIRL
ncbi:hypothetical protein [Streptomyces sp. UNOC14_S4]|uniref:hypothetical protein n=1 Tax=Streptomyces sp. UNOC14_S4 TaxID=2872340 RepID=UPI001E549E9E|nr:hypothetical protein [Streptomyces sp. UNOC14_S4]MCC3770945.1 hypothetical protein [Streptomyces sp. UNOC14_S4]